MTAKRNKIWNKELLGSNSRKASKGAKIAREIHCYYCMDAGFIEVRVNDKQNDSVEFKRIPCEVCKH